MKLKSKITFFALLICCATNLIAQQSQVKNDLRSPACPLITIDPNTSAWSYTDNLYDDAVRHWTDKVFPLLGVIKVDGVAYRFLGKEEIELEPIAKMAEHESWSAKYT